MSEKEGRGDLNCITVSQQDHKLHIPRFLCNHWNRKFSIRSLQNKNKPNFLLELNGNLMLYCLLQTLSYQQLSLLLHNLYIRNCLQKMIISTGNLSCTKLQSFSIELTLWFSPTFIYQLWYRSPRNSKRTTFVRNSSGLFVLN